MAIYFPIGGPLRLRSQPIEHVIRANAKKKKKDDANAAPMHAKRFMTLRRKQLSHWSDRSPTLVAPCASNLPPVVLLR